jgi:hypothetical protein
LRAFDQCHHLTSNLATRLSDPRQDDRVRHDSLVLLQRVYRMVAGYTVRQNGDPLESVNLCHPWQDLDSKELNARN